MVEGESEEKNNGSINDLGQVPFQMFQVPGT